VAGDLNTGILVTTAGTVTLPDPATLGAADMDVVELYAAVDGVVVAGALVPEGFLPNLAGVNSYASVRNVQGAWRLFGLLKLA